MGETCRRLPGQGVLVVLEGIDGAGKSTQLRRLKEALERAGVEVMADREPTDGPHGRRLRASATEGRLGPAEELELFIADRREHVEQVILPALGLGKVVLLDRYYFSNAAYQGSRGLDWEEILRVNEAFAPPPDLLFWLDLPPEASASRIEGRGMEVNAFEHRDQSGTLPGDLRPGSGSPAMRRIDASQSADVVFEALWGEVQELIQRGAGRRDVR